MEMFETTIQFKPKGQWRPGMTPERLVTELDRIVQMPGLANIWVPPIRNRIDMLATGIKSPIGVKVSGADLTTVERIALDIERVAKQVPGVSSALAERLSGGRYIDVAIRRAAAARYGLNVSDVQAIVASLIGGDNVGETVEGTARFPINVRYPRDRRDSLEALRSLPVITPGGQRITLGTVADVALADGPPMLKSENARLASWVYVDVQGRDLASVAEDLRRAVGAQVQLAPGIGVAYSGQFEFLERANARLRLVVPATLLIIFVLLYLTFRRADEAFLIMAMMPFALTGGIWFLYLLGYNLSIATGVGFIALAGVAAEFGVVMLIYLRNALETRLRDGGALSAALVEDAIREGAVQRVRPKAMTVAVILAGLLPILWGSGTGSEVMSRIAAPMVGGMVTAPLLSMLVIPAAYALMRIPRTSQGRWLLYNLVKGSLVMKKLLLPVLALVIAPFAVSAWAASPLPMGIHGSELPDDHRMPQECVEMMQGMKDMKDMPMGDKQSGKTHHATGTVQSVDAAKGNVTIAHGPVKSLNWPAMTMTFGVKDKGLLDRLTAGKKVTFDFVQEGNDSMIVKVK
jgi:Cu(I)/Ag(I) efflux system membrane protein CusA/SilA